MGKENNKNQTDKVCRTCLSRNNKMKNIFMINNLQKILEECASVQVAHNDGLSTLICTKCIPLLKKFHNFKQKCLKSDRYLRNVSKPRSEFNNINQVEPKIENIKTEFVEDNSCSETVNLNSNCVFKVEEETQQNADCGDIQICDTELETNSKMKSEDSNDDDDDDNLSDDDNFSDQDIKERSDICELKDCSNTEKEYRKVHKCDICNLEVKRAGILQRHKNTHDKENPRTYECEICHDAFYKKRVLRLHMTRHDTVKRHQCPKCDKRYKGIDPLIRHIGSKHKDLKPIHCSICSKSFTLQSQLRRHLAVIHKVQEQLKCSVCDETFSVRYLLKQHEMKHQSDKPYSCSQCDKSFTSPYLLNLHFKKHTGNAPPPILCNICGKQFNTNSLKKHMLVHTEDRPVECDLCGKSFKSKRDMKVHRDTHSGIRRYFCSLCGKGFTASNSLKQHMLIHTGERPHVCNVCGKAFTQKSVLKTHMKIH